ncbi:DUF2304 domain-containing protein [Microbacterium sp. ABRD28]|uniref:DUF2304 domain-containing protein n=1 Tax=Microbacterium sp. ABRD28 TaxID=2268461 RepID=UPI000F553362|nr:DUF2304 domain-containing protein [Microbacterium sp. ABRD28]AZC13460.1 DUF2304 domain-containing protein [Microbacterium sp. ABRD28]
MWIQAILIAVVVVGGVFVIRKPGGDSHLALRRLGLALFTLVAVASVLFPEWLTWLASLVGVGRGTDLLLYAFVLVFLLFVITQYRRNLAVNRRITLLSRRIALDEALVEERADVVLAGDAARQDEDVPPRDRD